MDKATQKLVLNALREASIKWPGRADCLKLARELRKIGVFKNGKPKYKYFWQCAKCLEWFRNQNDMEVDHIVEIGTFSGCMNDYISKLFCPQENLQALCVVCHARKSSTANATRIHSRKTQSEY